ncbi:MAG: hypothetical protein ABIH41_04660 [Nanoarchaeota archaeon]
MTDLELIFTMLGKKSTTEITKAEDSQGFDECKETAKKGGGIAGRARKDLENTLGKSIMTKKNYLEEKKDKRTIRSDGK